MEERGSEVDAHHHSPLARCGDLAHAGVGEDAPAPDVQLTPGDLDARLGDHRVRLDGASAASTGELDGRTGERAADTAVPERRTGYEAGDDPDPVVGGILTALLEPGPLLRDEREGGAGFDTAPPSGLAVDVGEQPGGVLGLRVPAVGLLTQPLRPLVDCRRPPVAHAHLEALTEAQGVPAPRLADDRLDVFPRRLVGRDDAYRRPVGDHRLTVPRSWVRPAWQARTTNDEEGGGALADRRDGAGPDWRAVRPARRRGRRGADRRARCLRGAGR